MIEIGSTIIPGIETSTLSNTYLTVDQKRKLSEQLKYISADTTRFNAASFYDPSKVRENLEVRFGKFNALNQTFECEREVDRGSDCGSGDEVQMTTYITPFPRCGFYNCSQEISDLLNLLQIIEENVQFEDNAEIGNLPLVNTVNEILKVFVEHYDNQLREKYNNRISHSKKLFFGTCFFALVFLIIGLPLLMFGYDINTGFIGLAYFTTMGTVECDDDYFDDCWITDTYFVYNNGSVACNNFEFFSSYWFEVETTHKIAVRRSNRKECIIAEDLYPNFIVGVFFLALCGIFVIRAVFVSLKEEEPKPEYILN